MTCVPYLTLFGKDPYRVTSIIVETTCLDK